MEIEIVDKLETNTILHWVVSDDLFRRVPLTFGAIIKQFLTQSFIQSGAAKAGAGVDNTAAPTKAVLMIETKESRRDRSTQSF